MWIFLTFQETDPDPYFDIGSKKELIVVALDVLSSLANGLETSLESFVGQNPKQLMLILDRCLIVCNFFSLMKHLCFLRAFLILT
jgi:hypothetical protein